MAATQWTIDQEPSSYEQIYRYFESALDECVQMIDNAEGDYYQTSSREASNTSQAKRSLAVTALTSWSEQLNELRECRLLRDVRNGKTIREILSEAKSGMLYGSFTDEGLTLFKRVLDKTNEHLYMKIPTINKRIEDIMNLMERYFLSFYEIDGIEDVVEKKKKENIPVLIYLIHIYVKYVSAYVSFILGQIPGNCSQL